MGLCLLSPETRCCDYTGIHLHSPVSMYIVCVYYMHVWLLILVYLQTFLNTVSRTSLTSIHVSSSLAVMAAQHCMVWMGCTTPLLEEFQVLPSFQQCSIHVFMSLCIWVFLSSHFIEVEFCILQNYPKKLIYSLPNRVRRVLSSQ